MNCIAIVFGVVGGFTLESKTKETPKLRDPIDQETYWDPRILQWSLDAMKNRSCA